jgi:rhamnosyltransferase
MDVSVVIRCMDKADTIEATLRGLRAQSRPVEIIVIDSGSTDGTVAIARRWADQVLEIPAESFSYGGALNLGAGVAGGSVHFAISAHCVPAGPDWIADSLACYEDPRVAATNQAEFSPRGERIGGLFLQSLEDAASFPGWGFSNHASSWRADIWRVQQFREDLPACEDKEWSWRVLQSGYRIAYSPALAVPSVHRRSQGLRQLHRRVVREAQAMVSLGASEPLSPSKAADLWWSYFSPHSSLPRALRRLSPYRVVELSGAIRGSRAGGRSKSTVPPASLFAASDGAPDRRLAPYNPLL